MSQPDALETQLRAAFAPTYLRVDDQSHAHAGHGATGSHLAVTIVSEAFAGKGRVERHQMVYGLLAEPLRTGEIHALALTARTPAEWAAQP